MAVNVEKSLGAPQGLPDENDPSAIDDQNTIVDITPDGDEGENQEPAVAPEFSENLAEHLTEEERQAIGRELVDAYENDDRARDDWRKTYIKGLDLLGLKIEDRTTPWVGACGVYHPVMTEAVVRFQAQAIMEIFPAQGPVKTKIVGRWNEDKEKQAKRVQEELNYFITEKMTEYRPETETLLFFLALAGSAFRKVYYDETLGRPVGTFIPAEDFVVPYGTTDLKSCPRYTHAMRMFPNDVKKLMHLGVFKDTDLPRPDISVKDVKQKLDKMQGVAQSVDYDERFTILEMHVDYDLPGFPDTVDGSVMGDPTGIALPYVITIEKSSMKVLAVRRNWKDGDSLHIKRQHFVPYHYLPGLGFYGSGLIHLIGGITASATSMLRQLVDAGTLSNLPAGMKTRGLRIAGDDSPIMPGEFRDVDVPSGSIQENIAFLPYKEPSAVLQVLMDKMVEEGRSLGAAPDIPIGGNSQEAPVGTTLALLERAMKVMSAVQARLHNSLKMDFKLIAEIIRDNMAPEYEYEVDDEGANRQTDFGDQVDIIPVSDPNAASLAQRVVQYQSALQLAQMAPDQYDIPELHRQMLTILGIPNIDKILKDPSKAEPADPVSENMSMLTGKPVKADIVQDHEAHIRVHMAAAQDPKIMAMIGQSTRAPLIMGAFEAHMAEHIAFQYRRDMEKTMGTSLPAPDQKLPPDVEAQLSKVVADAADKLLQKDIAEHRAQQAAQQMQDPLVQMEQKKLELQEAETKRKMLEGQQKAKIDQGDAALRQQEAQNRANADEKRIQSEAAKSLAAEQRARAEATAKMALDKRRLEVDTQQRIAENNIKREELQLKKRKLDLDERKLSLDAYHNEADRTVEGGKVAVQHIQKTSELDQKKQESDKAAKSQDKAQSDVKSGMSDLGAGLKEQAKALADQGKAIEAGLTEIAKAFLSEQEVVRGPDNKITGTKRKKAT